jgi:hypothetical protein
LSIVVLILAVLPLGSCQWGFDVQLVGSPTALKFVPAGSNRLFGRGPQPAIDTVEVAEVLPAKSRVVWSISRHPSCLPTSRFRYGVVPVGWNEWTKAQPLKPNVTYVVDMSGCGFGGGRAFKFLRSKIMSQDGTGDAPVRAVEAMK